MMAERRRFMTIMRGRLSAARYRHAIGVAKTAAALARRFGIDVERAWLAGLLHDYARELDGVDCLRLAGRYGLLETVAEPSVDLLHAPLGACLLRDELGVADPAVLQAVARHTTGDAGMTGLDKVVYLADAIEPGRAYPGVDAIRTLARRDLDRAVLAAMDATLELVRARGLKPDPRTSRARREIAAGIGERAE